MVFLEGCDGQSVFVLDGGFSSQISRHVGTTADGDPLWSARFLQTHPEDVLRTHLDFLRAGADIVSTNTYQASVSGFVKHLGVTVEEGYGLIRRAVELAKKARDIYYKERCDAGLSERKVLVAGSVGPYGAYLHDGSEYDGSYADKTAEEVMRDWHKPRIETLVAAGVDLLALETIPCQKEAEVLVALLREYPSTKAWLSFSCKDDASLARGENFQKIARKCFESNPNQILAVGVNCCSPTIVANLIRSLNDNSVLQIPIVTYPNSGEKYSVEMGWTSQDKCESLHTFVHNWLDLGVRYVGGCCRTYKENISLIHAEAQNWNSNKSS